MKSLRILSIAFGSNSVDQFTRGCFRSLMWSKNKEALQGATWDLVTDEANAEAMERLIWNGIDCKVEMHVLPKPQDGLELIAHKDQVLFQSLIQEIHRCLPPQSDSRMLLAPPDTIFGDGTIPNLLKLGAMPKTAVLVPHVRVLPELLELLDDKPIGNSQLVDLAFDNLHRTWSEAEEGTEKINSLLGGVYWRELEPGLRAVTHRLPTTYLIDFEPADAAFFYGVSGFGAYDHNFPGERLIRQQRARVCGSSDACFIVELTDKDSNIPPEVPAQAMDPNYPDKYWRDAAHNEMFRQFTTMFRGSKCL